MHSTQSGMIDPRQFSQSGVVQSLCYWVTFRTDGEPEKGHQRVPQNCQNWLFVAHIRSVFGAISLGSGGDPKPVVADSTSRGRQNANHYYAEACVGGTPRCSQPPVRDRICRVDTLPLAHFRSDGPQDVFDDAGGHDTPTIRPVG